MKKVRTIIIDGIEIQTSLSAVEIADLVQKNQELKKQLEEKQNPFRGIFAQVNDDTLLRDCGNMNAEIKELKNQQKEFIEYITSYIELLSNKPDLIEESEIDLLKEILSKFKEIIGDK